MGNTFLSYFRVSVPKEREKVDPAGPADSLNLQDTQAETILSERMFYSMLALERRRTGRSHKYCVLMLLDANSETETTVAIIKQAAHVALITKRETDVVGWYKENAILGMIVTEVSLQAINALMEILRNKIEAAFIQHLGQQKAAKISISMHVFPEISQGTKLTSSERKELALNRG